MHFAAAQRSLRGISLLLANGASINARDHRGRTPLHVACASCHSKSSGGGESDLALLECIELLLSSGALEDARDAKGQTALHLSALAGNLSAARALVAAGATTVADDAGNSPLHLAAAQGHSDIIQLLVGGNRDEPSLKPHASIVEEVETRGRCPPPGAVGELNSVFDVDLSGHQRGQGIISVGRHEGASTIANREAFGDDDVVASVATTRVQHFGARDTHSKVSGQPTEDIVCSRDAHPRYGERGGSSLKDDTPASVNNGHRWGGSSFLNSVPNDQDDPLGQRDIHVDVKPRWQEQADYHNSLIGKPFRNAERNSEGDADGTRGHHAIEAEHRRRKPRGSRLSRRRHGKALRWPDTIPSTEYEQVNGLH